MKILLINPPIREDRPANFPPLGLASVASSLREAGHDIDLLDLNMLRPRRPEVKDILPGEDYGLIGVSGLITTYKYLVFLMPLLREVYSAPIVIGGGGVTSAPDTYMENLRPDYVVLGEGEHATVKLVSFLEDGIRHSRLVTADLVEMDLDSLPMPAYDLLDMDTYISRVKVDRNAPREAVILAGRGCPMHCNFCYHVFGKGVRFRSVSSLLNEMEYLIDTYQVTSFHIGDECLTSRKKFVMEFCKGIIERDLNITWSAFSRLDTIDEEMMELMVKAGCNWIGFGLESGSQTILDAMNKKITVEQMRQTYLLAKKYFPTVNGTLIYGYPGETVETLRETDAFLRSIGYANSFFYLAAYPGTQVFEENKGRILERYGSLHDYFMVLDNALVPSMNLTDWDDETYLALHGIIEQRARSFADA